MIRWSIHHVGLYRPVLAVTFRHESCHREGVLGLHVVIIERIKKMCRFNCGGFAGGLFMALCCIILLCSSSVCAFCYRPYPDSIWMDGLYGGGGTIEPSVGDETDGSIGGLYGGGVIGGINNPFPWGYYFPFLDAFLIGAGMRTISPFRLQQPGYFDVIPSLSYSSARSGSAYSFSSSYSPVLFAPDFSSLSKGNSILQGVHSLPGASVFPWDMSFR